jgi:5-formyltetrahydrofolate cyclo-ligase
MTSNDSQNAKKILRAQLTAARGTLARDPNHSANLANQLFALAKKLRVKVVAAYLPFGTEPNIGGFVSGANAHGLELIMPVSTLDGSLHWVHYTGLSAPGIFGFDEPSGEPADICDAQLILIPATAVDRAGNRLGKGKGFYDIALSKPGISAPIAAVVYEPEVLENLPVEEHDHPVDFIVTPQNTIAIKAE